MKYLIVIASFVFLALVSSCRDAVYYTGDDVNCYECYTLFPETSWLIIDFTLDGENTSIPITVYNGFPDRSPVVFSAMCDTTPVFVEVPMNNYYSVKAGYKHGDDSVYAIDNAHLEAKLVTGLCDEDCWIITGGEYNVRLIY